MPLASGGQPTALIAEHFAAWGDVPHIVCEVFTDPSPRGVAAALDAVCLRALGAPVERAEFFDAGVGSVHGLRVRDGRRVVVVVKVHSARTPVAFLEAVQAVQRHLSASGFPSPVPLGGPVGLGGGRPWSRRCSTTASTPTRTTQRSAGSWPRRWPSSSGAAGRWWDSTACAGTSWPSPPAGCGHPRPTRDSTSRPRAPAPAGSTTWRRGPRLGATRGPATRWVGHTDWRAEHLRFAAGHVSAVYDWDSVSVEREPWLVGLVAHAFTANWDALRGSLFPSRDEALAFIADDEEARGAPGDGTARAFLRAHAEELLGG